jgi:copper(I)-binding protein
MRGCDPNDDQPTGVDGPVTMSRLLLVVALGLTACGGGTSAPTGLGNTAVVHAYAATVTPGDGDTAEVSLALHNAGEETDQLVGVSCSCAAGAEIHLVDAGGDQGPVSAIPLPPGEEVRFVPGANHIVLAGLTEPLEEGDAVTLELTFEKAEPAIVTATVKMPETPSVAD